MLLEKKLNKTEDDRDTNKTSNITVAYQDFINKTSEVQKSEWIEGKLIIQSPARKRHLSLSKELTRLMSTYADRHELGYVAFEKALINLEEGVQNFEPDIVFFSKEKERKMDDSTCMFEAPDLVVEILSKSTEKNDRGIKYKKYEKHGVKEYWIINAKKKTVELYYLRDAKYHLSGIYEINDYISSEVLKNFTIPIRALFNTYANLAELDRPVRDALTKQFNEILLKKQKTIKESTDKLEETDKKLEETDKKLEETDKKLEQAKAQILASIKLMKAAGLSLEQIMTATDKTKDFIENC